MGLVKGSSTLLRLGATLLACSSLVLASPAAKPEAEPEVSIEERQQSCINPCGWESQLCCTVDQTCSTNEMGQAVCVTGTGGSQPPPVGGGQGYWQYFTTTWVVTQAQVQTFTSVYSSFVQQAMPTAEAVPTPVPIPIGGGGCVECGGICCPEGMYCLLYDQQQCANAVTSGVVATPPVRPTSSGVVTATVPFESAVPTGPVEPQPVEEPDDALTPGQIAGIVIGTLAGIVLLLLICLFCCARALFDNVLAIFGFGKKKKRTHVHEETYIESGGHGRRWHGHDRPSRPEKKSKFGGLGGAAGILGALTLMLGMKRRHDRKHDDKSSYTSSGYYSSDYTSSSKSNSPLFESENYI